MVVMLCWLRWLAWLPDVLAFGCVANVFQICVRLLDGSFHVTFGAQNWPVADQNILFAIPGATTLVLWGSISSDPVSRLGFLLIVGRVQDPILSFFGRLGANKCNLLLCVLQDTFCTLFQI